jgi:hypothetical protein
MEQGSKDDMQIMTGCLGLICLGFITGGIVTLVHGDVSGIVLLLAPLRREAAVAGRIWICSGRA